MLEITKAAPNQYEAVRDFYYSLIDMTQTSQYRPLWEKGVYPADSYIAESIEKGELFIGLLEGKIAAAMIVNHNCNEGYSKVSWPTAAAEGEFAVIHALGVMPTFSGRGFAKEMARFAIEQAKSAAQKAVRLDVLPANLPADRLYAGLGFKYVDTVSMHYEDTGWTSFKLYEYPL